MPVFLFALSQAQTINWQSTAIAFVILHHFIFPSSNGYNSFQDRDETSIGGLKHPPKVTRNLYFATLFILDAKVPDFIGDEVNDIVLKAGKKFNITADQIDNWVIHPGGKKILDTIKKKCR